MSLQEVNGVLFFDTEKDYPELNLILEEIAEIRYIHLEGESEKCFINEISSDIYFDETRKHIILGKNLKYPFFVAVFDDNGHFLWQIGHQGRGPGEFSSYVYYVFDEDKDILTILDSSAQKLIQYHSSGEFIKELFLNYPILGFPRLLSLNDIIVIYNSGSQFYVPQDHNNDTQLYDFGWTIKAFDLLSLEEVPIQDHHYGKEMDLSNTSIPLYGICKTEDGYLLSCARSDTTYLLDTNLHLRPYLVDVRHNIERGFLLKPTLETKDYLFLHLTPPADGKHPNEHRYFAIRRSDHKVFSCGGNSHFSILNSNSLSISELLQSLTLGYGKYIIFNNFVPQPPDPAFQVPKEVEALAKEMDDESNPILMIIKFK